MSTIIRLKVMVQTVQMPSITTISTMQSTFSNITILQKMKKDNSIKIYQKMFQKNPITDFKYSIPHSHPVPVSPFFLDKC